MSASDVSHPNDRLRQERMRRNLSQQELAEELNTTVVTVNRWERGIQQPGAYYRKRLCELFGKSAEELGLLPDALRPQFSTEIKLHTSVETPSFPPASLDHHPDANAPPSEDFPLSLTDIPPLLLHAPQPQPTQTVRQQNQNRVYMLRRLRRSYRNLLENSLHGMIRLELGLARLPDAVHNATNLLLRMADHTEQPLPPGTSLLQAYEEAECELLILGAPGSGKSTLLRELALQLVECAEQEERHPLPVILPLSSWAQTRLPLEGWLSKQLCQIYNLPKKLVQRWIEEEQFLLLLDGLDEMEEAARPLCIAAINIYHHTHLVPLVVCSRHAEYEYAARNERLYLQSALLVQPLCQEQVDEYMRSAGVHVEALSAALRNDSDLQKLSTTPLMLSILTLTYHDLPVEELLRQPSLQTRQHLLFSHYVTRMFSRHGTHLRFPSQLCIPWLAALARQLRSHNQTVFYLEQIHPDWLPPTLYPAYHWLGIRLPAVLLGMLAGLIVFLFLHGALDNTASFPLMTLQGGLLGALFSCSSHPALPSSRPRRFPPTPLGRPLICLAIGVLYAFCSGINLNQNYAPALWLQGGCIVAGCMALAWWALLSARLEAPPGHRLLDLLAHPRIWLVASLLGSGLGLANALSRWLTVGQFQGPDSGLGLELLDPQNNWVLSGLLVALSSGLSCALSCALINGSSRAQTGELPLTERVHWTGRSLLHSLLSGSHLRTASLLSVLLALLSGLIVALDVGVLSGLSEAWNNALSEAWSNALSEGPCFGLSVGLSYWLLLGLFQGIAQERLLDQDRRLINEGIHRCARNGLLLGLLGGGLIGLIGLLSAVLSIELGNWLNGQPLTWLLALQILLGSGALLSLLGACFLGLLSGGLTLWRHFLLRLLLARSRLFPWPTPGFLAEMATRLLLQRVGGGYSFMHRLLLDYFADLHPPAEAPSSSSSPPVLH